MSATPAPTWRDRLPLAVRPYLERAPLGALMLGISSGFPYAMIGATLTTRLAQSHNSKKAVTAFALAFLVYNLKLFWAPLVDKLRLPLLGAIGQRRSWLVFAAVLVMASVARLGAMDPKVGLGAFAFAAICVGVAGATYDIVIDAYRIETLSADQLGVGSGMSQYGWRLGATGAGALALWLAAPYGWGVAYSACAVFALPALIAALWLGEPERRRERVAKGAALGMRAGILRPFTEFLSRPGAGLVLLFILIHKLGDTLGQLSVRLMYNDLGFTDHEIAKYDVGFGAVAFLVGVAAGGALYSALGLKRSVLISLVMMAFSNLGFVALAASGHSIWGMAAAQMIENFSSGIGGVTLVAFFSALCDTRFTATQYALISAAASVVGRIITGSSAGALVESLGYVHFYLFTFSIALPGVVLFWWMARTGMVDRAVTREPKQDRDSAPISAGDVEPGRA
jgi:PAT family beta-lactamase induction signal transducer AmpG